MSITIKDITHCLDEIAPFSMAESWDNVGLLVGHPEHEVRSLLIGLDPTTGLLDEAIAMGADTVITHHPAIFSPISSINTGEPTGNFLKKALQHNLCVFACHTNFDNCSPGVNDILAELLGLQELQPLIPSTILPSTGAGMGRIGSYPRPLEAHTFITRLLDALELASVTIAGNLPRKISSVALCGGSGSEFADLAKKYGADVYLSAEIKHHTARWAEETGFCIIDGSHFATEKPAVRLLAEHLRNYAYTHSWELDITETKTERHPFTTVDKNSFSQP